MTSGKSILAGSALALACSVCMVPLAGAQEGQASAEVAKADRLPASGQSKAAPTVLDRITITATMVKEAVIDALAGISSVDSEELQRIQADTAADIFRATPGVAASMNGDDPATAINIRGLQQFGRVVVTLDGARQDYWRVGHGSGSFYVEPELIKDVTVIRGPVSNAYGSGGIGGVVSFETKDAGDFLLAEERWALSEKLGYEDNGDGFTSSTTGAYRFSENADIIGNIIYRDRSAYDNGDGIQVPWTGETVKSGYLKATFRPADGHELKLGAILQNYEDFVTASSGSPNEVSRFDADTVNQTYTVAYTYRPEDNDLVDFSANAYHNRTKADQFQVAKAADYGKTRYYDVATTGFNLKNSSRFEAGGLAHTLTYGADYYHLTGDSDASHFGAGEQQGYGGFLQWQGDYAGWLQMITAIRYDGYRLDGETRTVPPIDASLSGDRWSPRVTLGVTPLEGFQVYGTYSEGYRSAGLQDVYRGGGAHGAGDPDYVPNLLLQPETAKSWEAGVNLKYNDVFVGGDLLRAKLNVFHTDVEDYIEVDLTTKPRTALNIGDARLKGIEAEAIYDYGWGFVNLSGALIDAKIVDGIYAGQTLNNTPLDRFAATLGFRAFEDKLTFGAQYLSVGKVTRTSRSNPAAAPVVDDGFNLVNAFANWQVNDNVRLDFGVDNIFNEVYTDPQSSWSTSPLAAKQGKGRTFKIALTGRIGG